MKDDDKAEIIRGIMSLPQGRAWIYDLLERCHVYHTTFTGSALSMSFQEGERNIGLEVLASVNAASPDMYIAMIREAQSDERNTGRSKSKPGNGATAEHEPGAIIYVDNPDDLNAAAYDAADER